MSQQTIMISGASGFIASWIVKQLLEQGHTVHGTVRNKTKSSKTEHLLDLQEKYPDQFHLFEADLLKEGSFKEAMSGCDTVIHTASPFKINVKDAQKELVDPALQGTSNVLKEVNKTETVKRVVLTSSVVAIYGDASDLKKQNLKSFTEAQWNTTSNLKHQPYAYSKTLAEKEAWEIQKKQNRWDLLVINPSFVLGPSLSKRTDGESTAFILQLLKGEMKTGAPKLTFGCVDVRDVANAHVLAATKKDASGRHITSENSYSVLQLAQLIQKSFPDKYPLPKKELPTWLLYILGPIAAGLSWKFINNNIGIDLRFDNSYTKKDLGINFKPLEDTLREQVNQLEKYKLV